MFQSDLHTHSTASDGSLSPAALVAAAAARGIRQLALTDHDTTAGLAEASAAAAELGIEFIPGIELTTLAGDLQVDVLGYLFDPAHPALQAELAQMQAARIDRARAMVERLQALGATIDYADVQAQAGEGVVTRPHVAHALVAAGFVHSVGQAFAHYIAEGRPAYVDRYRLTTEAACALIRSAGGLPSVAHPVPARNPYSDPLVLRHFLPGLTEAGLGGLECHYWGYKRQTRRWLEALAWKFGLVPTGGSDYHGAWRPNELGGVELPGGTVERMREAAAAGGVGRPAATTTSAPSSSSS